MSRINFVLSWVEYEKSFITAGPGQGHTVTQKQYYTPGPQDVSVCQHTEFGIPTS